MDGSLSAAWGRRAELCLVISFALFVCFVVDRIVIHHEGREGHEGLERTRTDQNVKREWRLLCASAGELIGSAEMLAQWRGDGWPPV